jgi:hypothetical protein
MAYKPASSLPPELRVDATIPEVMAYRRESARTVFRKLELGIYRGHKNGDSRLITWESVIADRERCLAQGAQLSQRPATEKRRVGRPRKIERAPVSEPHPASSYRKRKRDSAPAAE